MQVYISHGRLLLSFSHGKREDGSSPITGDPRERGFCTRVSRGPVTSATSRAGPGRGVRGERRWGGHGDISAGFTGARLSPRILTTGMQSMPTLVKLREIVGEMVQSERRTRGFGGQALWSFALVAMPLAVMPLATMPLVVTPMVNTCWWTLVTFNTFASGPLIPLYFNTFSYNTFSYNTNGQYTFASSAVLAQLAKNS